jgi:hypothetical protein
MAYVNGGSEAANALYRSAMGPDYALSQHWAKEW